MEEDNNIRPLDKLLTMLKSAGWECMTDEADSYLVVIDANGDPHECWDGGMPDYVNVCIPLSVDNAMDYFADPNQIYLKDENEKLCKLCADMSRELAIKFAEEMGDLPDESWEWYDRMRTLGIEVS